MKFLNWQRNRQPAALPQDDFQKFGKCALLKNGVTLNKDLSLARFKVKSKNTVIKLAKKVLADKYVENHVGLIDIPIDDTAQPPCTASLLIAAAEQLGRENAKNGRGNGASITENPHGQLLSLQDFIKQVVDQILITQAKNESNELDGIKAKLKEDLSYLEKMISFVNVQSRKISKALLSMKEDIQNLDNPKKKKFFPWVISGLKYVIPLAVLETVREFWAGFLQSGVDKAAETFQQLTERSQVMIYFSAILVGLGSALGILYGIYSYINNRKQKKKNRLEKKCNKEITRVLTYIKYFSQVEMARTGYLPEVFKQLPHSYFTYAYTGNFDRLGREHTYYSNSVKHPSRLIDIFEKIASVLSSTMRERLKFEKVMRNETASTLASEFKNGSTQP